MYKVGLFFFPGEIKTTYLNMLGTSYTNSLLLILEHAFTDLHISPTGAMDRFIYLLIGTNRLEYSNFTHQNWSTDRFLSANSNSISVAERVGFSVVN